MVTIYKRFFHWSFIFFFFIVISCQGEPTISILEEPVPLQDLEVSINGIAFELHNTEYEKSPSSISTTIINTTDNTCSFGDFYRIETMQDGLWYIVNYPEEVFIKYPNFIDIGNALGPNETVTQTFSLDQLNMELPTGQYRLVKTILCPSPLGDELTLAIPFKVG